MHNHLPRLTKNTEISVYGVQGGSYSDRPLATNSLAPIQRSRAVVFGHKILSNLRTKSMRFFKNDSKLLGTHVRAK
jgi:hypothetical protein